jgi:hypothetical protein
MTIWDGDNNPLVPDAAKVGAIDRLLREPRRPRRACASSEAVGEQLWAEGERRLSLRRQKRPGSRG